MIGDVNERVSDARKTASRSNKAYKLSFHAATRWVARWRNG